jgi:hypothetical protein
VKQPEEMWFQNEWKFARQCAGKYGFELKAIGAVDGEKVLSWIKNGAQPSDTVRSLLKKNGVLK